MSTIWTAAFWKAAAERIISTAAFALIGLLSVDGFDFRTAAWGDILQAVAVAASLSLLKGLVANVATGTGPSLVKAEITTSTTQDQLPAGQGMPYADEHPEADPDGDGYGTSLAEREAGSIGAGGFPVGSQEEADYLDSVAGEDSILKVHGDPRRNG